MKKVLLILGLLFCSGAVHASPVPPTLDPFQGDMNQSCPVDNAFWSTQKVTVGGKTYWWACTPTSVSNPVNAHSHRYWGNFQANWLYPGSGNWGAPYDTTVFTNKYGGNLDVSALAMQQRELAWGFNGNGEKSATKMLPISPCSGCATLPGIENFEINGDVLFNRNNWGPAPVKNLSNGMLTFYGAFVKSSIDALDTTNLSAYTTGMFTNDTFGAVAYINSKYGIGYVSGDTDFVIGGGPSPDFDAGAPAYGGDKHEIDLGVVTLVTSPLQTFTIHGTIGNFNGDAAFYTDPKVYSKTLSASPPATCDTTHPCSLPDFLRFKYPTVAALNAAWGTHYTTFGSAGSQHTDTLAGCTWNGSNTTCDTTTSLGNIDPCSVQIKVDGTLHAGSDCEVGAIGASAAIGGTDGVINSGSSTVNLTTGAVHLVFTTAPSAGSHPIQAIYETGGWTHGTGMMDESGGSLPASPNVLCLKAYVSGGPGSDGYGCRPGNLGGLPAANFQQVMAADLETWIEQYSYSYHHSINSAAKAIAPHFMYGGINTAGAWESPNNRHFMKGAAGNVDFWFPSFQYAGEEFQAFNTYAGWKARYDYIATNLGDVPIVNAIFTNANPDSTQASLGASGPVAYSSQINRGHELYAQIWHMLNDISVNGDGQFMALDSWGSRDFGCEPVATCSEHTNWGWTTPLDNSYDGHEPSASTVPCSGQLSGRNCGGESAPSAPGSLPYGDVVGSAGSGKLYDALTQWLSGSATVSYTLTINCAVPASVSVSPSDLNGNASGTCGFTRSYPSGETVDLTGVGKFSTCDTLSGTTCGLIMTSNRTITFSLVPTYIQPCSKRLGGNPSSVPCVFPSAVAPGDALVVSVMSYGDISSPASWSISDGTADVFSPSVSLQSSTMNSGQIVHSQQFYICSSVGGFTTLTGNYDSGSPNVLVIEAAEYANVQGSSCADGVGKAATANTGSSPLVTGLVTLSGSDLIAAQAFNGDDSFTPFTAGTDGSGNNYNLRLTSNSDGDKMFGIEDIVEPNNGTYQASFSGGANGWAIFALALRATSAPSPRFSLTINSTNPPSGARISVSPADLNGVTSGTTPFSVVYAIPTNVTLTALANASGNLFSSWSGNCSSPSGLNCPYTASANATLTANYVPITLTITSSNPTSITVNYTPADENGHTSCTTPCALPFPVATAFSGSVPATASGNVLGSITGADTVTGTNFTKAINSASTVAVSYVTPPPPTQFNVTLNSTNPPSGVLIPYSPADANGGTSCTTPCTVPFVSGAVENFTPPNTASGNNLASVAGCDSVVGNSCHKTVTANATITANYISPPPPPTTYTLTLQTTPGSGVTVNYLPADNNGGTSCVSPCTVTFNATTKVTGSFPSLASGNVFSSISGADTVSGTVFSKTLNANSTVTGNYISLPSPIVVPGKIPFTVSGLSGGNITLQPADANGLTSGNSFTLTTAENSYSMTLAPTLPPGCTTSMVATKKGQKITCTCKNLSSTQSQGSCQ